MSKSLDEQHFEANDAKNKAVTAKNLAEAAFESDPSDANEKAWDKAINEWKKAQSAFAKLDKAIKARNEAEEAQRAEIAA